MRVKEEMYGFPLAPAQTPVVTSIPFQLVFTEQPTTRCLYKYVQKKLETIPQSASTAVLA